MERPAPSRPVESRYAFLWDDVEPSRQPRSEDALGLSREDRAALGLAAPRHVEIQSISPPDATAALQELLAQGVALGRTERPRRR